MQYEFVNDKNKLYKKYLRELNRAINIYLIKEPTNENSYKITDFFSESEFYARYPEFKEDMNRIKEEADAFKILIYEELKRLNITEAALAERCHLSKQTLNKMINNYDYKPNSKYLFAIALGLEYDLAKAAHLLSLFGYCFNYREPADRIVYCCIKAEIFDIYKVNRILKEAHCDEIIGNESFEE